MEEVRGIFCTPQPKICRSFTIYTGLYKAVTGKRKQNRFNQDRKLLPYQKNENCSLTQEWYQGTNLLGELTVAFSLFPVSTTCYSVSFWSVKMVGNGTFLTSCQRKLWFPDLLGTQKKASGHLTSYVGKQLNALSQLMVELVHSFPPRIHPQLLFTLCTRHLDFTLAYFIEIGDCLFSLVLCSTYVPFLTQTLFWCSRAAT